MLLLLSLSARADELSETLSDPNPAARVSAYRALSASGAPDALERLAGALAQESDPAARAAGHQAIARLPLDEAQLIEVTESSSQPIARAWAAHALGRTCSMPANEALLKAATDADARVRLEAYGALGRCADPRALRSLSRAAVQDPSPEARAAAEQGALQATRRIEHDVPADIALLQAGELDARAAAAARLGEAGDWRATEPLLLAATSGPLELRKAALLALGQLDDHRVVPELVRLLDTTTGPLRYHVLAALAHLRDESTVPALRALLSDPDPTTRQLSVRALGWIGTEDALEALSLVVHDDDEAARTELVLALKELPWPARVEPLLTLTKDPSPFVRAEAARALTATGDPRAGAALAALLGDEDALVRLTAAEGAAALGAREAIEPLRALLKRAEDTSERAAYAAALAALGG